MTHDPHERGEGEVCASVAGLPPLPSVGLTGGSPLEGSGDFSIGGALWPGVSKLIEEAGEVIQVAGKLLGSRGVEVHWDGSNLRERLEEEIADLLAACVFVVEENGLDRDAIDGRAERKLALFQGWQRPKTEERA